MKKREAVCTEAPESISTEIAKDEIPFDFLPPPEELIKKHFSAIKLKTRGFKFDRNDANER
jgi:hypothetical protein